MLASKDEINTVPMLLITGINSLKERLLDLKNKDLYVEYIVLGSQIIEYMLEKLVVVYQHAINIALAANEIGVGSKVPLELTIQQNKNREGIGIHLEKLVQVYHCDDLELIQLSQELNGFRIAAAHKILKDYAGDILKLNSEIKTYVTKHNGDPIEKVFEKIINLQERITTDSYKRKAVADGK